MIQTIKIVAVNICIVMIITGVFSVLVPGKSFEKILKFAISLFFVCSVAVPMFSGELSLDFSFDTDFISEYESEFYLSAEESVIKLSEEKIMLAIDEILTQNGISAKKIEVNINIDENDSINITNVEISITENDEIFTLKIKEIVLREVGITPKIIID